MQIADAQLAEIVLWSDGIGGRIVCPPALIPAPGQYTLAQLGSLHAPADAPLPIPVFSAGLAPGGFLAAPPLPGDWSPGAALRLRGPLGRGFSIPIVARRIALIAPGDDPARLLPLSPLALRQSAAITLVTDAAPGDLPDEVEVQPMRAINTVLSWADYVGADVRRESLPALAALHQNVFKGEAQALVRTPMPCAGIADCGVCALSVQRGATPGAAFKLACADGPVFDLRELRLRVE
jgi:hypothetical protein